MSRTRKVPWTGWAKQSPSGKQRTRMYRKCGTKCFLGTRTPGDKQHPDFPICTKGTCKVNKKGLYAAYVRARQWRKKNKSYNKIAQKAKKMLRKRGTRVGK
jgi:hypothetical protein